MEKVLGDHEKEKTLLVEEINGLRLDLNRVTENNRNNLKEKKNLSE